MDSERKLEAKRTGSPVEPGRTSAFAGPLSVVPGGKALPRPDLQRHELSVVACDLRGFTAFLEAVVPERVIDLLRDYYAAVAVEVARFDAIIKDRAGDGVLVLVGAGRPEPGHARQAVEMALAILDRTSVALERRKSMAGGVGLGIGVASGAVTIGVIEAGARLEPVAVGSAVNLAARLCAQAKAGQVLVGERTAELLAGFAGGLVAPVASLSLKGFSQPVRVYEARGGCRAHD
ncbi:MAG: adenylate cyclase [Candidatus Binatota bacterium]|nr:adenylate cyclase [Candidatus Binatota bacterium]